MRMKRWGGVGGVGYILISFFTVIIIEMNEKIPFLVRIHHHEAYWKLGWGDGSGGDGKWWLAIDIFLYNNTNLNMCNIIIKLN